MFGLPIPEGALKWGGIALGAAAMLALAHCSGRWAVEREQLEDTIEVLGTLNEADNTAADERLADRLTIDEQKEELDDAIETGEDPDLVRLRRACLIMRQQGQPTADNPACRGFEVSGGAEAAAGGVEQ